MAKVATLLKTIATPWMRAVEAVSALAWPAPVDLITDFHDPWLCPSHLLYALALENSVDIWSDTWSDSKKRSVIARSVDLHRQKGTLAGIKAYVEIAGGQVKRATAPPQGIYAGGRDEDERADWLSRFPEFRLFTHEPWATDHGDAYAGHGFAGGGDDDGCFPPLNPVDRIHTRAGLLIQDGVEYPMVRREAVQLIDGVEQLVERFTPTGLDTTSAFADQVWGDDFLDTGAPLPTLTLSQDLAQIGAAGGGARTFRGPFLESNPERVGARMEDPAGAYACVDFLDAAYPDLGLDPAVLSFDRWRLADPKRSAGAVAPGDAFFGDADLLGLPAFTLLLDIQVDETAPRVTAFTGGFEGDYPDAVDTARTDLVLEAINSAADDCDRVLVRFARHRAQRLADRPTLPFRLGQLVADF